MKKLALVLFVVAAVIMVSSIQARDTRLGDVNRNVDPVEKREAFRTQIEAMRA